MVVLDKNIERKNSKDKTLINNCNEVNDLSTYNNKLELQCKNSIELNKLKKDDYFNDLLSKLEEQNLITDFDLDKINYDRMRNLQVFLKYYTKDESSSVTIEAAENVFKSLNFTLGVYMHQFSSLDKIINSLKNESVKCMLEKGRNLIKEDVIYTEKLLKNIQNNKLNINNYSYNDTIDFGLGKFFKTYNDLFSAHAGDADIDYQLAIDIGHYIGVEYMKHYLERLQLENKFCNYFECEEIEKLLYGYNEEYELLLLNIFEIILTNCIGHILAGNTDIKTLNITKYEKNIIADHISSLSQDDLKIELDKCCYTIGQLLNINDKNMLLYMKQCSQNMIPYIIRSNRNKNLDQIFITFKENIENNMVEYVDKESLTNEKFRYVADCIRNAHSTDIKIEIINTKIHSLRDLNDILDADCLFDDEYAQFFSKLPKMQIILLLKYIGEYGCDKPWHKEFSRFIKCMTKDDIAQINSVKEKINLI